MGSVMANIVAVIIIVVIVGAAVRYIWKERKKGIKCIGCPYSATCSGGCHGSSANTKKDNKQK